MINVTIYSSTMDPMGYVCGLCWDCAEQLWDFGVAGTSDVPSEICSARDCLNELLEVR